MGGATSSEAHGDRHGDEGGGLFGDCYSDAAQGSSGCCQCVELEPYDLLHGCRGRSNGDDDWRPPQDRVRRAFNDNYPSRSLSGVNSSKVYVGCVGTSDEPKSALATSPTSHVKYLFSSLPGEPEGAETTSKTLSTRATERSRLEPCWASAANVPRASEGSKPEPMAAASKTTGLSQPENGTQEDREPLDRMDPGRLVRFAVRPGRRAPSPNAERRGSSSPSTHKRRTTSPRKRSPERHCADSACDSAAPLPGAEYISYIRPGYGRVQETQMAPMHRVKIDALNI